MSESLFALGYKGPRDSSHGSEGGEATPGSPCQTVLIGYGSPNVFGLLTQKSQGLSLFGMGKEKRMVCAICKWRELALRLAMGELVKRIGQRGGVKEGAHLDILL